ncbi:hypothetical protein HYN48_14105 [Flavobacterium magnum]|uniref:Lipoprotein n=1 Tax=Flavobacterium magnum TaxID=2162713 RepID=A0A2S0RHA9_9FLAO|nr:hypothetical protein [Flavobacterium magnum]AWA31133.1 hypothetical protein HYN48_14105 [Flavobacterium magnum]
MNKLPFIILLLIFIASCKEKVPKTVEFDLLPMKVPADTTNGKQFITIIPFNAIHKISLTKTELKILNEKLNKSVMIYNKIHTKKIDLKNYNRQYFPYINAKGEKQVEINCFCQFFDNDNWKSKRVDVSDGGESYFNLNVNLDDNSFSDLSVNGRA